MKEAVLALYLPIVAFALPACWLFIVRLIIPALKHHAREIDRYVIGLSAACALGAHAIEQVFYWTIRVFSTMAWLNDAWVLVGTWKLMILASAVLAYAGLSRAATGRTQIQYLTAIAIGLWVVGWAVMEWAT